MFVNYASEWESVSRINILKNLKKLSTKSSDHSINKQINTFLKTRKYKWLINVGKVPKILSC